jgi:hypothetical protein
MALTYTVHVAETASCVHTCPLGGRGSQGSLGAASSSHHTASMAQLYGQAHLCFLQGPPQLQVSPGSRLYPCPWQQQVPLTHCCHLSQSYTPGYSIASSFKSLTSDRLCFFAREAGDPRELLRTINPREAQLLDPALGAHVRFRLEGATWPPLVMYKIFTHRPVAGASRQGRRSACVSGASSRAQPVEGAAWLHAAVHMHVACWSIWHAQGYECVQQGPASMHDSMHWHHACGYSNTSNSCIAALFCSVMFCSFSLPRHKPEVRCGVVWVDVLCRHLRVRTQGLCSRSSSPASS